MQQNQTGIQTAKIHWYPGHMAKTRRLISENLNMIDVVVEITDARIPFSGRNPGFDDILKDKPRIIVMNKYDLADTDRCKDFIKYYNNLGFSVIPISCATGMGINNIFTEARKMISEKIEKNAERGMNKTLKLMMVGIPNVGKSSLINRLVGKASTITGNKPGVTKGKQWIRIRGNAELLDTPGILPKRYEDENIAIRLAYTGAIKDEVINFLLLSCNLLEYLRDNYPENLCDRYKISEDISSLDGYSILEMIGAKRGFLISGGEIDVDRAAKMVVDETRNGKIGNLTFETVEELK